jgi:hypothetical protein
MDKQKKTFCVRDFGNDREYDDVGELMVGLREHYAGRSVAVHVRTPRHGMLHAMFIDVSAEGVLLETYPAEGRTRVTKEVFEAVRG